MPLNEFNRIDEEYFESVIDEDFSFKGHIKGRLDSAGLVIIGPNSVMDADITSKELQCFGKINGNIVNQEEIYLHAPSQINGDITTDTMTVEKGCRINGKVTMIEPQAAKADKPGDNLKILFLESAVPAPVDRQHVDEVETAPWR